jgi:hypothetical protein
LAVAITVVVPVTVVTGAVIALTVPRIGRVSVTVVVAVTVVMIARIRRTWVTRTGIGWARIRRTGV